MSELYVKYSGLDNNIEELEKWKEEFNELHDEFVKKLTEMNKYWRGDDYNKMKANVMQELEKITGPDGKIQKFVKESTNDLLNMKNEYANIQNKNASYWGQVKR